MDRRSFLKYTAFLGSAVALSPVFSALGTSADTLDKKNLEIFRKVVANIKNKYPKLPEIGDLTAAVGKEFVGTPYVAGTLEGDDEEKCRINLTGFDCVTFFETSLGIARCIRSGKTEWGDLIAAVTESRYRGGYLDGYLSRLHYTSDWMDDNSYKGIVHDITAIIGGEPFEPNVGFMSSNPQLYPALKADPKKVESIKQIEKRINAVPRHIIKTENIAEAEKEIKSGDIIAIATSKKGLDYSHTGLALREGDRVRFMHAGTKHKKVMIDTSIAEYAASIKTNIGISVARPL